MKILYFSPHPDLNLASPAGYGTHMREMIHAFRDLGHEVETCIMGGEQQPGSVPPKNGLKQMVKSFVYGRIWESLRDLRLVRFDRYARKRLSDKVTAFMPDVIYERGYYLMTSGVRVAREKKITHILEMNAPYLEEKAEMQGRGLLSPGLKREKEQISKTDRLVVVSTALKEYYEKKYPGTASKTLVTPNAVRPDSVSSDPSITGE